MIYRQTHFFPGSAGRPAARVLGEAETREHRAGNCNICMRAVSLGVYGGASGRKLQHLHAGGEPGCIRRSIGPGPTLVAALPAPCNPRVAQKPALPGLDI
eukprot:gene6037-biopygen8851